jgi:hypothetical protein
LFFVVYILASLEKLVLIEVRCMKKMCSVLKMRMLNFTTCGVECKVFKNKNAKTYKGYMMNGGVFL